MRPLYLLSLAILLSASQCTLPAGTYSVSVNLPADVVIGQQGSATAMPTPTWDPTPTAETDATFAPTWTPSPDAFVVYEVTARPNLRSSAGLRNPDGTLKDNKIGILEDGQLVELDPRIFIEADGYIWRQVFSHVDGSLLGWVAENWLQVYRA